MRSFKFRAWDNIAKQWLLGYGYKSLGGFSLIGELMLLGEWSDVVGRFIVSQTDRKPDDLIIEQFTGFLDKNEKEIYEGDILKVYHWQYEHEVIGVVAWSDGGWVLNDKRGEPIEFWNDGSHNWYNLSAFDPEGNGEVIGNIHDNPNLIK